MATLELVEKLRQHAEVSYDDARDALDACKDDLLDAIIYLERKGKIPPPKLSGVYTTEKQTNNKQSDKRAKSNRQSLAQLIRRFFSWLRSIIRKSNSNLFVILQKESEVASFPVTILILMFICCFWVVVPLLIVGLFCGFSYRFRGREFEQIGNRVMDTVAEAVDDLKQTMKDSDKE